MTQVTNSSTLSTFVDKIKGQVTGDIDLLTPFIQVVESRGLRLYAEQEEAILALFSGQNVILNTPTGSGKSLVAQALHFEALCRSRQSYYTSPIKALVNEKFLDLCREFGSENVGMITGDATVNARAPIICCTAEILANLALREGSKALVNDVVIDEFHYYSDRDRGSAWQIPLLTLSKTRFLLMSATLGDTRFFSDELTRLNALETSVIKGGKRPVPLDFRYSEDSLTEAVVKLVRENRAPIYIVNFSQKEAADVASEFLSLDFCSKEEKSRVAREIEHTSFKSPYGKELVRLLKHGVGIHHAGLLPRYRVQVEKLAQKGLLKIISGTDTLGVGVNVPIRTVLLTKLCKFDGQKTGLLSVRDFHQIAGRAGRKGFDDLGVVVAQAPEHVIDNLRNEQKAMGDAKKQKKLVKRKPPERGFYPWDKTVFTRLIESEPETLVSRFRLDHGLLLQILSREDGPDALVKLINDCHESDSTKKHLKKVAFTLFRTLVERKIIEIIPVTERISSSRRLKLNVSLQEDFSLNQSLSVFLLDTLKLFDPISVTYALDVLSLVESILENPDAVLRKQVDRAKTERMAELKAAGVEFDQRIEELEKVEYPKPNAEFIYERFNEFAKLHPWVGGENIRPKSIAREMVEVFALFSEYVKDLSLQRSEGLLLRYLSDAYKTLVHSVPVEYKNAELISIESFLRSLIREVDSSLVDEWEKLRLAQGGVADPKAEALVSEERMLALDWRLSLKTEVFKVVRALSRRDLEWIESSVRVECPGLAEKLERYFADHMRMLTTTPARANHLYQIEPHPTEVGNYFVTQSLIDPEQKNDWELQFEAVIDETSGEVRALVLREFKQS